MKLELYLIPMTVLLWQPAFAQPAETHRVVQRTDQNWDGETWANERQISWTFTEDGGDDQVLYHAWFDGAWQDDRRGTNTYDGSGGRTNVFQDWDGSEWSNTTRTFWQYDEAGNQLEQISEGWKDGAWEPRSRRAWTYDESGHELTQLSQTPDGAQGWVDAKRWSHTYDEEGSLVATLTELWGESGWTNDQRLTVTYDQAGNRVLDSWEKWDADDWVNFWREGYDFDESGHKTSYLYEEWGDGAWNPDYREALETDDSGNITESLAESMTASGWENTSRIIRTYVEGGSVYTESIKQNWNGTAWENKDRILQEVEAIVSTAISGGESPTEQPDGIRLGQNYPNPFNPSTQITFSVLEPSHVRINVFDVQGRQVAELANDVMAAGEHAVTWVPGTEVGSGIYLYRLEVLQGGERHAQVRSMLLSK